MMTEDEIEIQIRNVLGRIGAESKDRIRSNDFGY
jgi:hypothetical protein